MDISSLHEKKLRGIQEGSPRACYSLIVGCKVAFHFELKQAVSRVEPFDTYISLFREVKRSPLRDNDGHQVLPLDGMTGEDASSCIEKWSSSPSNLRVSLAKNNDLGHGKGW